MSARVALLVVACACGRLDFDPVARGQQRKPIAIAPGVVSLVDFPVAVVIASDADLAAGARSDGSDLAFTAADGATPLDFEIERYDGATGALVAWVREPALAGPTTAYLYFGGQPTVHDPTMTWPGCLGVWHMTGVATESDSTVHAHTLATPNGDTVPATAAGVAGGARAFDGVASGLAVPDPADGSLDMGTRSYSITLWVNMTSAAGQFDSPLYKGGSDNSTPGYDIEIGTHEWRSDLGDGTGATFAGLDNATMFTGTWTQLAAIADRSAQMLTGYANGAPVQAVDISAIGSIDSPLDLQLSTALDPFHGALDELRLFDHALSADWIAAEYRNLTDPSFVTVGPAEPAP